MDVKWIAFIGLAWLYGCEGAVVVDHRYPRREPVVVYREPGPVYRPAPGPTVVVEPVPAPVYYEEGTLVGGVVVVEPPGVTDYVFVNGGYYYWHPGLNIWVHARRAPEWRPTVGVRVYGNWAEHPAYRRGR